MKTSEGIKKFRDRERFNTQTDLAKALEIKPGNVSLWEADNGFPSFQIAKKLLEMGITVEELFGVEYNEKQQLVKASPVASEPQQAVKKLKDFEASLLKKLSDEYAGLEDELESLKKLKEIYKLEKKLEKEYEQELKELEKNNTMDFKKRWHLKDQLEEQLRELEGQIEKDEDFISERLDARNEIKSIEEELEQTEDTIRWNLNEIPGFKQRILKLQGEMESNISIYVHDELWKLKEHGSRLTKGKIEKWSLELQIESLQKQIVDEFSKKFYKERMQEYKEQLANICFNIAKEYLKKRVVDELDERDHFLMLTRHYSMLIDIEKKLDSLDLEHLKDLNNIIEKKYKRDWYINREGTVWESILNGFRNAFRSFVYYCYTKEMKENNEEIYFNKAIEVMNKLDNKIHGIDIDLNWYRTAILEELKIDDDIEGIVEQIYLDQLNDPEGPRVLIIPNTPRLTHLTKEDIT